jgi:hypothetical protein
VYIQNATNRFAIGPVVKISDGAVQAEGVAVRLLPEGGAAAVGTGTVGYQDGIVHYTPAAGEMDAGSVIVVAHKADCLPVAVTVTTTKLAVDGDGKVAVPDTQKVDVHTARGRAIGDVGEGNTAHLLQAADTGDTTVARKGANAVTLTTAEDKLDTLLSRITSTLFAGITSLGNWLRLLARKDAGDATAKSELNDGGGGYDEATDSQEAIRDTAPLGTAMRGTDNAGLATELAKIPKSDGEVTWNETALASVKAEVDKSLEADPTLNKLDSKIEETPP